EVAERLARLALHYTYKKTIVAKGPFALKAEQKKEAIWISFASAKQLTTSDKKALIGFELVTDKGQHIEKEAMIVDNQVVISIPKGKKIKTVLYAWKPFTLANLVNEAGLPCSTFKLEVN
ncbi:MAG: sialate O-acetylesterase, partial [Flavobacteriaceae bacterium]|nr:sialate O-acetylesterase [Flavobacteriaceae bacterium]